jgi:hypothetical protein
MLDRGIGPCAQHRDVDARGFHFTGRRLGERAVLGRRHHRAAVTVSERGTIKAPERRAFGFNVNVKRIEALTVRKEAIK